MFAEWASGVSATLDPETVNKHVTAMVDAVSSHLLVRNRYRIRESFRDGCSWEDEVY